MLSQSPPLQIGAEIPPVLEARATLCLLHDTSGAKLQHIIKLSIRENCGRTSGYYGLSAVIRDRASFSEELP
jgi:hypothetical protein